MAVGSSVVAGSLHHLQGFLHAVILRIHTGPEKFIVRRIAIGPADSLILVNITESLIHSTLEAEHLSVHLIDGHLVGTDTVSQLLGTLNRRQRLILLVCVQQAIAVVEPVLLVLRVTRNLTLVELVSPLIITLLQKNPRLQL